MKKNLTKLLLTSMLIGNGMLSAHAQTTQCQTPPFRTTITGNEWASGEMLSLNLGSAFTPHVEFHAKGSLLFHQLCSGSYIPNQNAGTYFYWDAFKGAIRAGLASSTGWNGVNVGTNSAAFGEATIASGSASFASGNTTTASGDNSFSCGLNTVASNHRAFAANNTTTASGESSFAINTLTTASGPASFASGEGTTASGSYSASFGTGTVAQAINTVAMGYNTTASGTYSLSTGYQTSAQGLYSSSFGINSLAFGEGSAVFGTTNNSLGEYSFSVNSNNTASGDFSFASGYNNTASGVSSASFGSNGSATGASSFAAGSNSDATGSVSISLGENNLAAGIQSFAIGGDVRVNGNYSFGIGNGVSTPITNNVYAIGSGINVPTHSCIFMGVNNTSNATPSLFIGDGTGQSSGNIGVNSLASANTKVTILGENTSGSFSALAVRNTNSSYTDMFRILNSGQTIIGYTGSIPGNPAKLLVIADGNLPNNDAFQVQNWNGTSLSELMYINRNGNVGLEITSPASRLHSHIGTSNPIFHQFTNAGTGTTSSDGFKIGLDPTANEVQLIQQENADMTFYTNAAQRAVIKSSGELGIGIAAPTSKVHIKSTTSSSSSSALNVADFTGASLLFVRDDGNVGVGTTSPGSNLSVSTGGAFGLTYATLTAPANGLLVEGRVGIGNISPTAKVEITGAGAGTGTAALKITDNVATPLLYVRDDGNTGLGNTAPANKLTVSGSSSIGGGYSTTTAPNNGLIVEGEVGIGTSTLATGAKLTVEGNVFPLTSNTYDIGSATYCWNDVYTQFGTVQTSDSKKKENIKSLSYGIELINKLNPVTFNFINDQSKRIKIGFIAQELHQIIPEVVKIDKEGNYGVYYSDIIPILTKGIQEQQQIIEQQNQRINQLEVLVKSLNIGGQNKKIEQAPEQKIILNDGARLLQNEPNPFSETTIIKYYLPANTTGAMINVTDMNGKLISSYKLQNTGYSQLEVKAGDISQGAFNYTLEIDGKIIDSKKMVLVNN